MSENNAEVLQSDPLKMAAGNHLLKFSGIIKWKKGETDSCPYKEFIQIMEEHLFRLHKPLPETIPKILE